MNLFDAQLCRLLGLKHLCGTARNGDLTVPNLDGCKGIFGIAYVPVRYERGVAVQAFSSARVVLQTSAALDHLYHFYTVPHSTAAASPPLCTPPLLPTSAPFDHSHPCGRLSLHSSAGGEQYSGADIVVEDGPRSVGDERGSVGDGRWAMGDGCRAISGG